MKNLLCFFAFFLMAYSGFSQGYCTPSYYYNACTYPMSLATSTRPFIIAGSTTLMDNNSCSSSGSSGHYGYQDFSATTMTCTLNQGATYSVSAAGNTAYTLSEQIWIDFNNDSTFQSTESVGGSPLATVAPQVFSITIPTGVATGYRRMRALAEYNYHNYPTMNPCPTGSTTGSYYFGDVRDYLVFVGPSGPWAVLTPSPLSFGTIATSSTSSPLMTVLNAGLLTPSSAALTVTAPSDFLVCNTVGGTYVNSYTISYSGATVASNSIFVKAVAPSTTGSFSGCVNISGGGLSTVCLPVSFVAGAASCSGTPSGGTVSHGASTGCGNAATITFAVSGHTSGVGIVLQWQSSPSGSSTWTNISGATSASVAVAMPMITTRYRCVVTCTSSTASANSSTDSITLDNISGHVWYVSVRPDTLEAKVWLIYHNVAAGTLTAIDSVITCLDGLFPYYEFAGMGTGNYLVKARSLDYTSSVPGTGGYVPTYGNSFPVWSSASVISHAPGRNDTMQISVGWGTVTSGPGFIGGLISSGAGKGTAADVPKANLLVFLMDTSRHVLTYAYTDTGGRYSFNNLAYGNYIIYPEDLDYTTTPSATLSLSSAGGSSTGINFRHRTTSKTIVPVSAVNLTGVSADSEPVILFPNPASDQLTISMNGDDYQIVSISNNVGATVIQRSLERPSTIINIKDLAPGVYFVKLTGEKGSVVKKLVKM